MKKQALFPIAIFISIVIVFFAPFLFSGKLPIPADTIIGLYHPYRDLYAQEYPNGIPYKNFLITDPVRQQYPWKWLAIDQFKKFQLPVWNPYSFAGAPLLATFQGGVFYPLNIIFFIFPFISPFSFTWSLLIFLQSFLAGFFLYFYLRHLRLDMRACLLSAIAFSFSGFSIAWLEWNTIGHTVLWLPLLLLSIDKILSVYAGKNSKFKIQNSKSQFKIKNYKWLFVFALSLISSFFAGHLQVFFYVFLVQFAYLITRWFQYGRNKRVLLLFGISYFFFIIITAIQWIPTLQFIQLSARDIDVSWQKEGWFIPWQNVVQFIAPDFFGNPATLNYWGKWNYGEFVGYVGIFPFIMALYSLFFRYDKKVIFFGCLFFLSLLFSYPTFFAKIPYLFNIPFLSTAQPTRLVFVTDFSLAILAGLGFDYFLQKKRKIAYPIVSMTIFLGIAWVFVLWMGKAIQVKPEDIDVAKRNLYFPTAIFFVVSCLLITYARIPKKYLILATCVLFLVTTADLLRFANKFTPFTQEKYLYPSTKVLKYLQKNTGVYRIMTTDQRIFPPNFNIMYGLQSINGYDPLYVKDYANLIAASERNQPNTTGSLGFNRIIVPQNYNSRIIDVLGVKYVLSLTDIQSSKLKKVFQEGQTQVYENTNVLPRAFFVEQVEVVEDKQSAMNVIFDHQIDISKVGVVLKDSYGTGGEAIPPERWRTGERFNFSRGNIIILYYSENKIIIQTEIFDKRGRDQSAGFLVLTDMYYPTWHAKVDGNETHIYKTDYTFRGVVVPEGRHVVTFYNTLF